MAFKEEKTNADAILKGEARAGDRRAGTGGASLVIDSRSRSTAERPGRRGKRSTVHDRVLLQSEVGPCGRIPGALQEKPLSRFEKRDRTGPHAESEHDCSALSH